MLRNSGLNCQPRMWQLKMFFIKIIMDITPRRNNLYTSINGIPSPISSITSSSSDGVSADNDYSSIPRDLTNGLILNATATVEELTEAITKCKEMVIKSEQCSSERKWLVRCLVELRFRLQEMEEGEPISAYKSVYTTMGHHFAKISPSPGSNVKLYCDHCSGVIWIVLQGFYTCNECGYVCHSKCVEDVIRVCAHIVATEGKLETNICEQKGLALQHYKCGECKTDLNFKGRWSEPRLCDYSGLYYCSMCHWNNVIEIPARIIHNWDWEKRPVSQAAYQLLTITKNRSLINLSTANVKLFNFVTELDYIRKLRNDLKLMRRYLITCQDGNGLIPSDKIHLAEAPDVYSIEYLELARDGVLEKEISCLSEKCREHIMRCKTCYGNGYLCELCGNNDVIFPFDSASVGCAKCNSLFHYSCWNRKNKICPKCIRLQKRREDLKNASKDLDDGDIYNEDDSFDKDWLL